MPPEPCGLTGGHKVPAWLNCSRRGAPPRREPSVAPARPISGTQGTWKKGESRTEPLFLCWVGPCSSGRTPTRAVVQAVNLATYSYTPWHLVPVGSSMLGHGVPGAERIDHALMLSSHGWGHALMLLWRPAVGSEYGPYFLWVCPYYGPSKIESEGD